MNYFYNFVVLLICIGYVHAQPYTTQGSFTLFGSTNNEKRFTHCLDGSGSGSIFVTGATDGTALGQDGGNWDWFVTKYNQNNGFLTTNADNPTIRWLATNLEDVGVACASDVYGAAYVIGYTSGVLNPNDTISNNGRDVVVAKYDANMNRVWIRQMDVLPATSQRNSYPVDVAIYGSTLYLTGFVENQMFVLLMATSSGQVIRSTTVPSVVNTPYPFRLAVDVEGMAILVGTTTGYFAGTLNSRGETVAATTSINSNLNSFIMAFYPDNLERKFQLSLSTNTYNQIVSVTTDSDRSIYVAGTTRSSLNGVDYLPTSQNNFLPFFAKYSASGAHMWTRIYPQVDNTMFRHLVVDNIGGLFLLRTRYDCQYPFPYDVTTANLGYNCAGNDAQFINLLKADINGAIQWDTRVSTGIPLAASLDNTGVLTIGGSIGGTNSLHGVSANGYDGFLDQININYNCSCGNLAELVQEMTELLNIVPE